MLGDGKLDSLDTRLEQFKLNNATNQNELLVFILDPYSQQRMSNRPQAILREYSQLLDDYKALKRSHGENGKSMKNGDVESNHKTRNPYVLVLIDGNGYIVISPLAFQARSLANLPSSMTSWSAKRRKAECAQPAC